MAKKSREIRETEPGSAVAAAAAVAEHKLEDFAEDLGTLLGHAQNRAESWLAQRKAIGSQLTTLRDTADRLLSQLGLSGARDNGRTSRRLEVAAGVGDLSEKRGPGRPKRLTVKKRTLSAEARARIAEAQRRRWAKQKPGAKG